MQFNFVVQQDSDSDELLALSSFISKIANLRRGVVTDPAPKVEVVNPTEIPTDAPTEAPVEKRTRRSKPQTDEAAIQAVSVAVTAAAATAEVPTEAPTETPTEVPTEAPTEAATTAPVEGEKIYTQAEAQIIASDAARRVGPEAVKKLIAEAGATRIADLQPDALQDFIKKLQAL